MILSCSGVTEETLGINPRVTVFLRCLGSQLKLLRYDRGEDDGSMDLRDKPKDDGKEGDGFFQMLRLAQRCCAQG